MESSTYYSRKSPIRDLLLRLDTHTHERARLSVKVGAPCHSIAHLNCCAQNADKLASMGEEGVHSKLCLSRTLFGIWEGGCSAPHFSRLRQGRPRVVSNKTPHLRLVSLLPRLCWWSAGASGTSFVPARETQRETKVPLNCEKRPNSERCKCREALSPVFVEAIVKAKSLFSLLLWWTL